MGKPRDPKHQHNWRVVSRTKHGDMITITEKCDCGAVQSYQEPT